MLRVEVLCAKRFDWGRPLLAWESTGSDDPPRPIQPGSYLIRVVAAGGTAPGLELVAQRVDLEPGQVENVVVQDMRAFDLEVVAANEEIAKAIVVERIRTSGIEKSAIDQTDSCIRCRCIEREDHPPVASAQSGPLRRPRSRRGARSS